MMAPCRVAPPGLEGFTFSSAQLWMHLLNAILSAESLYSLGSREGLYPQPRQLYGRTDSCTVAPAETLEHNDDL